MIIDAPIKRAVSRPKTGHHRNDVQGLRAIAILLVVVYHSKLGLPGGFIGVDVFFVISGFVISGLLFREFQANGRISLGGFYVRRARRLLPALAVVSLVTIAVSSIALSPLGPAQQTAGEGATAASFFSANALFFVKTGGYFQSDASTNPFLHTWSLSAEEQFYLFFPVTLIAGWLLSRRRQGRLLLMLIVVVFGLSFSADLAFSFNWFPHVPGFRRLSPSPSKALEFAFYSPVTRAWEFLAGVLVGLVGLRGYARSGLPTAAGIAGAALLVTSALCLHVSDAFPGYLATLPVMGTALLIYAGQQSGRSAVSRALSLRPMVVLGDLSYSWYLWHWPAIVFAIAWYPANHWVWAATAVAALIPAAISYRWIERPIHRREQLTSPRATALLTAACIALPALGGVALYTAWRHSWGRQNIAAIQAAITPEHIDQALGCASEEPLGSKFHAPCIWRVAHPTGTILLIGDSNAGHLSEPMIQAARNLNMNLQIATDGGCPFLVDFSKTPGCASWAGHSLTYLLAHATSYSRVVISNDSLGYLSPHNFPGTTRAAGIARWGKDLRATVSELSQLTRVLVIGAVPQFPLMPNCLERSILLTQRPASCGHLTPAAAAAQRDPVIASERMAIRGLDVAYYDTAAKLCAPSGSCDAFLGGKLVYRDGAHLSVSGSMIFVSPLQAALTSRG